MILTPLDRALAEDHELQDVRKPGETFTVYLAAIAIGACVWGFVILPGFRLLFDWMGL